MAFSWSMTTLATASVCLTCAYRLIDYRRRGVLRFGEIKTAFHISLLVYGALGLPYDMFCLVNYDVWQVGYGTDTSRHPTSRHLATSPPRHLATSPPHHFITTLPQLLLRSPVQTCLASATLCPVCLVTILCSSRGPCIRWTGS